MRGTDSKQITLLPGKSGENSTIAPNDHNEIFLRLYIGKGYYIILSFSEAIIT